MKTKLLWIAVSACALAAIPATASIVAPNGDFEQQTGGVAAGWNVANTPALDVNGNGVGGSWGEVFGPGSSKIEEDINLGPNPKGPNPAVTYTVTFWAMNLETSTVNPGAQFNPLGGQQFEVRLANLPVQAVPVMAGTSISDYTEYSVQFTTTLTGERKLSFEWTGTADKGKGTSRNPFITQGEGLLDNITVTDPPPAVPEPSTWIAGISVLIPFGMSTLRVLRGKRIA